MHLKKINFPDLIIADEIVITSCLKVNCNNQYRSAIEVTSSLEVNSN